MTAPEVPDPAALRSALDRYVQAVTELGAAAAASAAAEVDLRATVAQLRARVAELEAAAGPEVIEFADFTALPISWFGGPTVGKVLPSLFLGKGPGRTVLRMAPGSSTQAARAKALVKGQTNPLTLLRVGSADPSRPALGVEVGEFTLQGTDQGHEFNGLFVGASQGAYMHDIVAGGIPGSGNEPPWESFTVDGWNANGSLWERIALTGDGVAASLFGMNNSRGVTVRGSSATGAVYGMGYTGYKCADQHLIDLDLSGNRRPLNFEECGGVLDITRCDLRKAGKLPHITVNSLNRAGLGSARVTITDPRVDAWPLRVGVTSDKAKNLAQRPGDVKLYLNGVDMTGNPKYLACGDVW